MPLVNVIVSPLVPPLSDGGTVPPTINEPNVTAPALVVLLLEMVSAR